MKMKIFNSMSLNLLPIGADLISIGTMSLEQLRDLIRFNEIDPRSYLGHADIAAMVGLKMNRETCQPLENGETFAVVQYTGQRLPEGTTKLPEGASVTVRLFKVSMP
jgi:hypothetical protein